MDRLFVEISTESFEFLKAAGISTTEELAKYNPKKIYSLLLTVNEEKRLLRKMPSIKKVEDWVKRAKTSFRNQVLIAKYRNKLTR